jgi:hypothetical protein
MMFALRRSVALGYRLLFAATAWKKFTSAVQPLLFNAGKTPRAHQGLGSKALLSSAHGPNEALEDSVFKFDSEWNSSSRVKAFGQKLL